MKVIVGLGNPGKKFKKTRHNAGWLVIEDLFEKLKMPAWQLSKKLKSEISKSLGLILAKPQTFMNDSGVAVKKTLQYNNLSLEKDDDSLWIVHDDLDLSLGELRIVKNKGAAGHHGVESVIKELNSQDFVRFRLGIRTKPKNQCEVSAEEYVLEEFKGEEKELFDKAIKNCVEAVSYALDNGVELAMNRYNKASE